MDARSAPADLPADPPPSYVRPPLASSPARRIGAVVLRHWYLLRGSWPRALELAYWPTVQLLLWGFLSRFLATNSSWVAQAAGVLIAAVLLWDVLVRSQMGMSVSFLEEMWSRNLGNLFVSPLRPAEWVVSLIAMALIRTLIGLSVPVLIAIPLFDFNLITSLGLPLLPFFANLMLMGVAVGLVTSGLILRHGMGAESLAWMAVFVLAPVSAVYYPVTALPAWLQPLSLALPSTHVFEGMRATLFGQPFHWGHLGAAVGLNLLYGLAAALYFLGAFRNARTRGALLQTGE
ncbi:ABC transporter permease [Rhodospirillum centenum]|uniref:Transport permease protein n=1 Tax=Rhodospirillum centenum (strain ATCC 51521 / SW) TaxID=414684 RepID=B6IU43_RHOCS|nr:ABC transporter permease [Rhodospirillum centenum]ACI99920.1 ABC transporter permease protein, putative [Rhodospirillum centenum SW]